MFHAKGNVILLLGQDEIHETSTNMCERFRGFCVSKNV